MCVVSMLAPCPRPCWGHLSCWYLGVKNCRFFVKREGKIVDSERNTLKIMQYSDTFPLKRGRGCSLFRGFICRCAGAGLFLLSSSVVGALTALH